MLQEKRPSKDFAPNYDSDHDFQKLESQKQEPIPNDYLEELPEADASFKSGAMESQNDQEPGRCPDSVLKTGEEEKVRII